MAIPFSVSFTAPGSASNITATPEAMLFDPPLQPSAVRLAWTPITTPPEQIQKVEVWAIDSESVTRILRFTDPAVTNYLYPFPRSRDLTNYRIIQWISSGGATKTGLWGAVDHTLVMDYISLVSVERPTVNRVIFPARNDFSETWTQEQTWQVPAGGLNYKELPGSLAGKDFSLAVQMFDRIDGSNIDQLTTRRALWEMFRSKETACIRHDRAVKEFGRINGNPTLRYQYGGKIINADIGIRRTSYTEGVSG